MVFSRLKNKYIKKIKLIAYEFNYISKNYDNIFLKIINYILLAIYSFYQFILEFVIIFVFIALISYFSVSSYSKKYIYDSIEEIPYNDVALVLGTSKYLSDGRINMYFKFRMDAAYELYTNGKVKYILVSGDNRHRSYNEPRCVWI